jgi:hypothetical protein
MKNTFVTTRIVVIIIVVVAAIAVSLGIFGVFSSSEIKDSLQKAVEVGLIAIVASALISVISK